MLCLLSFTDGHLLTRCRDFSTSYAANAKYGTSRSRGPDFLPDLPRPASQLTMRSGSMNNLLEAHATLSQYKYGVMDDSKMHMISLDAHHFNADRQSPFESLLQDPSLQQQMVKSDMPAIRNGADIAGTCRYNAALAASLSDDYLANTWLLLAVCFDILVITEFLDESAAEVRDTKESCRRMVMSGLLRDWSGHALGRPLLSRIFSHLGRVGDLQTIATITCICGGAKAAAFLLGDSATYTALSLDRILLRYIFHVVVFWWFLLILSIGSCQICRYIAQVAVPRPSHRGKGTDHTVSLRHEPVLLSVHVQVSKYVTRAVSSAVHLSGVEGLSNSSLVSIKLGLYCHRCGREVMPWGPSGGPLVKKGPWCSACSVFALQCCVCELVSTPRRQLQLLCI